MLPIFDRTLDRKDRKSEHCEFGDQPCIVELLMHRITSKGMGQTQVEQRPGRK